MANNVHDEILALIKRCEEDAYERGRRDALTSIVQAANGALQPIPEIMGNSEGEQLVVTPPTKFEGRQRAPRGSAERVIRRAFKKLREQGIDRGITLQDILNVRQGDEMKLVESSIRGELRRGKEAGRYEEDDGFWLEGILF